MDRDADRGIPRARRNGANKQQVRNAAMNPSRGYTQAAFCLHGMLRYLIVSIEITLNFQAKKTPLEVPAGS